MVARFQGGPNAGHSIQFDGKQYVFHNVPSGVTTRGVINVIGDNVVIDPYGLMCEIKKLHQAGYNQLRTLKIAKLANLIMPTHRALDAAKEKSLGKKKVGTTGKGIGPCYTDHTARRGLLVGYMGESEVSFKRRYNRLKREHLRELASLDFNLDELILDGMTFKQYEKAWFEGIEYLRRFERIDCSDYIQKALRKNKRILAEGAQGSMLDIKYGSYPFVTSSNVLASGVCAGLGIAPNQIGRMFGIVKAYCTRVGEGPFHTELHNEIGEKLRQYGHEFGATTGRPRRCGWLDLVALKHTVQLNGVTDIVLTKADVMRFLNGVKVAVGYKYNGKVVDYLPFEANTRKMTPVYKRFPGWKKDISSIRKYDRLPKQLKKLISFIEQETHCRVSIVSVGPEREATIIRNYRKAI